MHLEGHRQENTMFGLRNISHLNLRKVQTREDTSGQSIVIWTQSLRVDEQVNADDKKQYLGGLKMLKSTEQHEEFN